MFHTSLLTFLPACPWKDVKLPRCTLISENTKLTYKDVWHFVSIPASYAGSGVDVIELEFDNPRPGTRRLDGTQSYTVGGPWLIGCRERD